MASIRWEKTTTFDPADNRIYIYVWEPHYELDSNETMIEWDINVYGGKYVKPGETVYSNATLTYQYYIAGVDTPQVTSISDTDEITNSYSPEEPDPEEPEEPDNVWFEEIVVYPELTDEKYEDGIYSVVVDWTYKYTHNSRIEIVDEKFDPYVINETGRFYQGQTAQCAGILTFTYRLDGESSNNTYDFPFNEIYTVPTPDLPVDEQVNINIWNSPSIPDKYNRVKVNWNYTVTYDQSIYADVYIEDLGQEWADPGETVGFTVTVWGKKLIEGNSWSDEYIIGYKTASYTNTHSAPNPLYSAYVQCEYDSTNSTASLSKIQCECGIYNYHKEFKYKIDSVEWWYAVLENGGEIQGGFLDSTKTSTILELKTQPNKKYSIQIGAFVTASVPDTDYGYKDESAFTKVTFISKKVEFFWKETKEDIEAGEFISNIVTAEKWNAARKAAESLAIVIEGTDVSSGQPIKAETFNNLYKPLTGSEVKTGDPITAAIFMSIQNAINHWGEEEQQ